jgi:hypothetical protein
MKAHHLFVLLYCVLSTPCYADDYGPFNLQSGKVTKQPFESGGKSADHGQCYASPPERFFIESGWNIQMISAHGKNADCHFESFSRAPVDVTLPNGTKVTLPMVNNFCVRAHAETGSGFTAEVVTAWAECNVSANTVQFK